MSQTRPRTTTERPGAVPLRADRPIHFQVVDSPVGPLTLAGPKPDPAARSAAEPGRAQALSHLVLDEQAHPPADRDRWVPADDPGAFRVIAEQLDAYFAGELRTFDVDLALRGTVFQHAVWRGLTAIPYAATWSYAELARHVGRPAASRPVGSANGRNPVPIIVPCHRVVGADGSMTGYSGGLERKGWLLEHERRIGPEPG
jgi:methylated-DNA-[protein]-cysteine S-methyltransferase